MRLTNYKVNFLGVQQDKKTQNYISEIVSSITPRVPAGSSFVLNILENNEKVLGDFTINSISVSFKSSKVSATAIGVIDLIYDDINKQIGCWIERRVV